MDDPETARKRNFGVEKIKYANEMGLNHKQGLYHVQIERKVGGYLMRRWGIWFLTQSPILILNDKACDWYMYICTVHKFVFVKTIHVYPGFVV